MRKHSRLNLINIFRHFNRCQTTTTIKTLCPQSFHIISYFHRCNSSIIPKSRTTHISHIIRFSIHFYFIGNYHFSCYCWIIGYISLRYTINQNIIQPINLYSWILVSISNHSQHHLHQHRNDSKRKSCSHNNIYLRPSQI